MSTLTKSELAALRERIQDAAQYLKSQPGRSEDTLGAVLYTGNPHDSIPRRLILDPILSSSEIHTWQIYRLEVGHSPVSRAPKVEALGKLLKSSRMTVYRNLSVLRALRWLTLCEENARDSGGSFTGAIYMIHDEPLGLAETIELDPGYIEFLEKRNSSISLKRLNEVKESVLQHVNHQIMTSGEAYRPKSRLGLLVDRIKSQMDDPLETDLACPPEALGQDADLYDESKRYIEALRSGAPSLVRHDEDHDAASTRVKDFAPATRVKDFAPPSNTCNTSNYINTCNTCNTESPELRLPKILALSEKARQWTLDVISQLPAEERQIMLDYAEAAYEKRKGTPDAIRTPIPWLKSCVKKRLSGQYQDFSSIFAPKPKAAAGSAEQTSAGTVLAKSHLIAEINTLKDLLKANVDEDTKAELTKDLNRLEFELESLNSGATRSA